MNLYVSTSRKPSQLTRKLARWLAALLGAHYENRGKRGVEECAARAAARGLSRLLFVYEKRGNPSEIVFRDAREGWLEPSILISSASLPESRPRRLSREVKAEVRVAPLDEAGKKIMELFGLGGDECEVGEDVEAIEFVASTKEIFFRRGAGGKLIGPVIKIAGFGGRSSER